MAITDFNERIYTGAIETYQMNRRIEREVERQHDRRILEGILNMSPSELTIPRPEFNISRNLSAPKPKEKLLLLLEV